MPIFPQLGPIFYDEKDRGILSRMEAFYADSITMNQAFWAEADTDTRYEAGDATLWQDLWGNVPIRRRRQFTFNRVRPIVNMIGGYQRRNRKSTICVPIENADQETADQYTKVLMWIAQQEGVLETISESFHGALVTGMNFLHVWLDYRTDPISGNIRVDNTPYNAFIVDPYFKKHDLSDCNAIWKRSWLSKRECLSLLPSETESILALTGNEYGSKDPKFQFMAETYNYGMKNLLTYDEFYYRAYRNQRMLIDSKTGETSEWRGNDDNDLREYLQLFPEIIVVEQEIPTVRLAIVVQGKVMFDGPNPLGIDRYPFIPTLAYYNPQMPYYPWRVQGVVRNLRDPMFLYNHRKIIEMDILESQITSGWIAKEDALVNPDDIWQMQGQGKGLILKSTAQMTDVQQIQAPQIPPSMFQLSEGLAKELQAISGVNEELMGSAVDDKAGILSMLRQGAGLTQLQLLFDQLDYTQKQLGKLMLDVIQVNWAPGKIKKILQEEPTPQFRNRAFGTYDCAIEEGFNTTTQKQMEFAQLLQLRELGVPVTDEDLIDRATVQGKQKLIENMQKRQQQQQQMQQQQAQIQIQELQSRVELNKARSVADRGLGRERDARAYSDRALAIQKIHEAKKEDEIGLLNLVKALKEIDGMDIEHLERLITLSHQVKQAELQPTEGGLNASPGQENSTAPQNGSESVR